MAYLVAVVRRFSKRDYDRSVSTHIDISTTKRIILIQLQGLGDALVFTPVVSRIKEYNPDIAIDVLCTNQSFPVYKDNKYIERYFFVKQSKSRFSLFSLIYNLIKIRRYKFNVCLLSVDERSYFFSLISYLTGAQERIGFREGKRKLLNTYDIEYDVGAGRPFIEMNQRLLSAFGLKEFSDNGFLAPDLFVTANDEDRVNAITAALDKARPLVCFNAFARKASCRWNYEHSRCFLDLILGEGYNVVLIGGQEEKAVARREFSIEICNSRLTNMVGDLSLSELVCLLKKVDIFVTMDTGPMHLCLIDKVKTVVLFSGFGLHWPWIYEYSEFHVIETGCELFPCGLYQCAFERSCLDKISPEELFAKIKELCPINLQ